jgi:hypothetical protein
MRTDVQGRLHFRLTFAGVDSVQFFFADYYGWMERAFAELMAACGYPRRIACHHGSPRLSGRRKRL